MNVDCLHFGLRSREIHDRALSEHDVFGYLFFIFTSSLFRSFSSKNYPQKGKPDLCFPTPSDKMHVATQEDAFDKVVNPNVIEKHGCVDVSRKLTQKDPGRNYLLRSMSEACNGNTDHHTFFRPPNEDPSLDAPMEHRRSSLVSSPSSFREGGQSAQAQISVSMSTLRDRRAQSRRLPTMGMMKFHRASSIPSPYSFSPEEVDLYLDDDLWLPAAQASEAELALASSGNLTVTGNVQFPWMVDSSSDIV